MDIQNQVKIKNFVVNNSVLQDFQVVIHHSAMHPWIESSHSVNELRLVCVVLMNPILDVDDCCQVDSVNSSIVPQYLLNLLIQ